mgnify:CR=1 FL=1
MPKKQQYTTIQITKEFNEHIKLCGLGKIKKGKDIEKYTRAKVLLESLKNAASCYNDSLFTKIKTALNSLCASVDCKSCG